MKELLTAAALVAASASFASAQTITPICAGPAATAGVASTHNVIYDAANQVCVATRLGQPMFGTPGYVAGAGGAAAGAGALVGGLGTTGVVIGAAAVLGIVIAIDQTGGT